VQGEWGSDPPASRILLGAGFPVPQKTTRTWWFAGIGVFECAERESRGGETRMCVVDFTVCGTPLMAYRVCAEQLYDYSVRYHATRHISSSSIRHRSPSVRYHD
jgi:hypothetical protein